MTFELANKRQARGQDLALRTENRYDLHPKGLRRCKKCREVKPIADYPKKGRGRLNANCKSCENDRLANYREQLKLDPYKYCRAHLAKLRHRAKEQGVPFDLTVEDLFTAWEIQKGQCFYTGHLVDFTVFTEKRTHPHLDFPSVDRKDPKSGYVPTNIVWCTYRINRMKNDLDEQEFTALCKLISERFFIDQI
jgi:hypothetical protein